MHTLIYDTIYAHQDIKHDKQLGLYSTAYTLPPQMPLYIVPVMTALLCHICYLQEYGFGPELPMMALGYHLFSTIQKLDLNDPAKCGQFFRGYQYYYMLITLVLVGSAYRKSSKSKPP
jgi:4-hydroxybenzoate polyprenyltransferase